MKLSALDTLINALGLTRCADEFGALVDLAQHTSDPLELAENPIFRAMLEDRLNDAKRNTSQSNEVTSLNATAK